jgi:hypothetical protein
VKSFRLPDHQKNTFARSGRASLWCPNAQAPAAPVREQIDLPVEPRAHCAPHYQASVTTKAGEQVLVDGVLCNVVVVDFAVSRDGLETWFLADRVQP